MGMYISHSPDNGLATCVDLGERWLITNERYGYCGEEVRYLDNHNMDPNVLKSGTFNVIWRKPMLVSLKISACFFCKKNERILFCVCVCVLKMATGKVQWLY